jgi:hypothetical protein
MEAKRLVPPFGKERNGVNESTQLSKGKKQTISAPLSTNSSSNSVLNQ